MRTGESMREGKTNETGKRRSGCDGGLERQGLGLLHAVFKTFAQHGLCAGVAFAAAGADAQLLAQLRHGRHACFYGTADLAFGDVVANTDDHCAASGSLSYVVLSVPASGSEDQLVQLGQPQAVDPALMVDFDFALLLEQVLALEARCLRRSQRGWTALAAAILVHHLPRRPSHLVILL